MSSVQPHSYTTEPLHQDRHALATLFSFIETIERVLTIGRVCHLWLKYSADPIAWAHDGYVLQLHPARPYPGEIPQRYRPLIRSVRLCGGVGDIKTAGSVEVSRMMNLASFTNLTEMTFSDLGIPKEIVNEIAELFEKAGMGLESRASIAQTSPHRSIHKLGLILSANQTHHLTPLLTSPLFRHLQQLHIRHLHVSQVELIGQLQQLRELRLQEAHPRNVWEVIHRLPLLDTLTVRLCDPIPTRPLPPSLTSLTLPLLESDLDGRPLFSSLETSPPPQLRTVKVSLYKLADSADGEVHPGLSGLAQLIRHLGSLVSLTSFQFTYFHFIQRTVPEPQLSSIHVGWLVREFIRLNSSHLFVPDVQIALPMFLTFSMVRRPSEMDLLPNNVGPVAQVQFESVDEYVAANPSTGNSLLPLFTLTAPYLSSLIKLQLQQVRLNGDLLQTLIALPTSTLQDLTIIALETQTDLFSQLEKCQQFWTMIGRQHQLQKFYFNPFRVLHVATNELPWTSSSSSSSELVDGLCVHRESGGGLAGALVSCSALKKLEFYSYAQHTFFNERVCYALAQSPSLESLAIKLCSSELRLLIPIVDSSISLKSLTLYTFPPIADGNTPEANQLVLERDNVDKIEFLTLLLTYNHLTCLMNGSPIMDVLRHEEQFRQERMKKAVKQDQKCTIS